jgi:hypothetical protein
MLASQFLSVFALVHYGIVAYFLSVEHVRLKLLDGFKKSKISLMLRKGYVKPSTIFQQAELKYQDFLQSAKFASSSSSTQQQQARAAMKKTTDTSSSTTTSSSSFFPLLRLRGGGGRHHGKHNKIGAADEVKRNMLLEMIKIDEVEEEDAEEEQEDIQTSSNNNVNHHQQQPATTKTAAADDTAAVSNTSSALPPSMNFDFVLSDMERGGSFNNSEYNGSAPPSSRIHGDDSTPPPPESLTAIAGVNHPPPQHRILHHLNSFDLHQFTLSNNTGSSMAPFSNNETLHNHHIINHPYHGKVNTTTTTTTTTTVGTAGKSFDSQSGLARRRGSAAESVASSRCSSKDSVGRALVVLTTFEVLTIAYVKEAFEEFDYDHTGVLNITKLKMVSRSTQK